VRRNWLPLVRKRGAVPKKLEFCGDDVSHRLSFEVICLASKVQCLHVGVQLQLVAVQSLHVAVQLQLVGLQVLIALVKCFIARVKCLIALVQGVSSLSKCSSFPLKRLLFLKFIDGNNQRQEKI